MEEKKENDQKRDRIPNFYAAAYITVAIFCDVVEWLLNLAGGIGLVLNRGITIAYNVAVFLFLQFKGVPFWEPKRFLNNGAGFLLEFIPLLDLLPAKTATAFRNIRLVRREDKEYNEAIEKAGQKNLSKAARATSLQKEQEHRAQIVRERNSFHENRADTLEKKRKEERATEENGAFAEGEEFIAHKNFGSAQVYNIADARQRKQQSQLKDIGYRSQKKTA